jgi:hypothetical protein
VAKAKVKRTGKPGRPRVAINLKELEDLAKIGCTDGEIADWFGVGLSLIKSRKKTDKEFSAALKKGRAKMVISLRRVQLKSALEGNATMQIWLGKQLLGQREPKSWEREDDSGAITVSIKGNSSVTTRQEDEENGCE